MITVILLSPSLDITYLVDGVQLGDIHRPREVIRLPGGKGLNLARAARRMGAAVRVVTPLGGAIGELVAELATESGVEIVRVPVSGQTRSCVTVSDDGDGSLTEFYESAPGLEAEELDAVVTAVDELPAAAPGWTVLSGSVPAGVSAGTIVKMLRRRALAGDRVAIDTHGDCLRALVRALQPDLVKVNRYEASELLLDDDVSERHRADALDLAQRIRAQTDGAVIVTDGSNGSAAVDTHGRWRVSSTASPGRFPVGSGDTFLAGLLTALQGEEPLENALMLASTSAGANASVPGAAEFDLAESEGLRALTTVTSVA